MATRKAKKVSKKAGTRPARGGRSRAASPSPSSSSTTLASLAVPRSAAAVFTALRSGAAACELTFDLSPDGDGADFHRFGFIDEDTESNQLVFNGSQASAVLAPGPHRLVWTVAGQPGEGFAFELTGDIDRKHASGGFIPPARVTSGVINFVAVSP